MKIKLTSFSILLSLLRNLAIGVMIMNTFQSDSFANERIRAAAVAGSFYPLGADELRKELKNYLSGPVVLTENPILMISPHAGYVFSGPVAGKGYATINKNIKRVILIGPSHYKYIEGVVLTNADYYHTPLGKVKIDKHVVQYLRKNVPSTTAAEAEGPEHCIEVQLPFLQVQLSEFSIVPILTGKCDIKKIAEDLLPYIDKQTLVIASSDFSHYHGQGQARSIDDKSISCILNGQYSAPIEACGETPIKIIMKLAEKMGLSPVKLDARTSFETAPQYGSESKVVGYASIVYIKKKLTEKTTDKRAEITLSPEMQHFLLSLARQSLNACVSKSLPPLPQDIPAILNDNRGCFVTLTMNGALRGCIGYIDPIMPLYKAVIENARNAALNDPRFSPVTEKEVEKVTIEVSALTEPEELLFEDTMDLLKKLEPHVDGVILQKGSRQSTFLPQVWEQLPDKRQFLEHLALKAGIGRDEWKSANYKVYQVECFQE